MVQSKYNKQLTRKQKFKRYRKTRKIRKGGTNLKELATREMALQMIQNKIPISELRKAKYPEDVVKPIEIYMAATTIAQKEKERPLMTNILFVKNLIRKRTEQGKYTAEELDLLNEYYMNIIKNIIPSFGNEPNYWTSDANKRSKEQLSKENLLEYMNPDD